MRSSLILVIISAALVGSIACSNHKDPILPEQMDIKTSEEFILPQDEPISEFKPESIINRNVMGAWKVIIDTESLSAEIVPARNASAIGDIYDADLSQFLFVSPCHNCLRITRLSIDHYGNLLMTIGMKHPFGDITRRPDLHGFDVRMIFISDFEFLSEYAEIEVMNPDGTTHGASFDNTGWHVGQSTNGLLNADGYTSHFSWLPADERYFASGILTTGNINPFLRFFDDPATGTFDPHAPAGYNVMPVGSGFQERTAVISKSFFQKTTYNEFYIVADVAYGHSAVLANRQDPQYYLPSFNRTEPWRVEFWIENNNLHHSNPASTADLVVQVFDWQHGYAEDPEYPDPSNLSGLRESSNVLQLELSIPEFQDDLIIATTPESGTGHPNDPLQYRLTVTNQNLSLFGVMGLLAIRDELHGQPQPSGRLAVPESPSGLPYETLDILDYSLYMPVFITMKYPSAAAIGSWGNIDWELLFDYEELFVYGNTRIAPNFFMDPSNKQFQYYWDYNYDGVTFNADGTGLPSPKFSVSPGYNNVALGVRTNSVPPRDYIYELPVYGRGKAFQNPVLSPGTQNDITSTARNHSAARGKNNKYYLTFVHENGGQRDIMLAVVDRDGSMATFPVTDTPNINYMPSLHVLDDDPGQGVYVAYAEIEGSNQFVYVKRGSIDGTGFLPAPARRISTVASGNEYSPVITYFKNALRVYYMNIDATFRVYASHSDDHGTSWTNDGWVLNNGSNYQMTHTLCVSPNTLYMAWSDGIDHLTNRFDLYLSRTDDGVVFPSFKNMSTDTGLIEEVSPSMDIFYARIVIAYMTYPEGATDRNSIKVINVHANDWRIVEEFVVAKAAVNDWLGAPSVGCASNKRFIITYSFTNNFTNDLTMQSREYHRMPSGLSWNYSILNFINMGTVDSNIRDISPLVISTSPQPYVVENFFAWTDYSSGSNVSSELPRLYYGDINVSYHVTQQEVTGGWL